MKLELVELRDRARREVYAEPAADLGLQTGAKHSESGEDVLDNERGMTDDEFTEYGSTSPVPVSADGGGAIAAAAAVAAGAPVGRDGGGAAAAAAAPVRADGGDATTTAAAAHQGTCMSVCVCM